MRVPGFEPGAKPWQGLVLPGYTTPAHLGILNQIFKVLEPLVSGVFSGN